jgi:hypothetical protein
MDNIAVCGKFVNAGNYRTKVPTSDDAFQPDSGGKEDGIVFMLTPDGQRKWATYFGGSDDDDIRDIDCDEYGTLYFLGYTISPDLPASPGAFQSDKGGGSAGLIARFDNNGHRIWATYFGGSNGESCYSLDFYENTLFITGMTSSLDFPIFNNPIYKKDEDIVQCFIGVLNVFGEIIWTTIFGGYNPLCFEVTKMNQIVYSGSTTSFRYPITTDAFQKENPSIYPPYPAPASSMLTSFNSNILSKNEGIKDRNILIYPNPCTTNFNLTTQNYEQIEIIRITNIYGQEIEFSASQSSPNHTEIYINCTNGIYFLELEVSGEKIIKKFIVNK